MKPPIPSVLLTVEEFLSGQLQNPSISAFWPGFIKDFVAKTLLKSCYKKRKRFSNMQFSFIFGF